MGPTEPPEPFSREEVLDEMDSALYASLHLLRDTAERIEHLVDDLRTMRLLLRPELADDSEHVPRGEVTPGRRRSRRAAGMRRVALRVVGGEVSRRGGRPPEPPR